MLFIFVCLCLCILLLSAICYLRYMFCLDHILICLILINNRNYVLNKDADSFCLWAVVWSLIHVSFVFTHVSTFLIFSKSILTCCYIYIYAKWIFVCILYLMLKHIWKSLIICLFLLFNSRFNMFCFKGFLQNLFDFMYLFRLDLSTFPSSAFKSKFNFLWNLWNFKCFFRLFLRWWCRFDYCYADFSKQIHRSHSYTYTYIRMHIFSYFSFQGSIRLFQCIVGFWSCKSLAQYSNSSQRLHLRYCCFHLTTLCAISGYFAFPCFPRVVVEVCYILIGVCASRCSIVRHSFAACLVLVEFLRSLPPYSICIQAARSRFVSLSVMLFDSWPSSFLIS